VELDSWKETSRKEMGSGTPKYWPGNGIFTNKIIAAANIASDSQNNAANRLRK